VRVIDASQFVPLAVKLSGLLRQGVEHYATLKGSGMSVSPEIIAMFIEEQMHGWEPHVRGRAVLDSAAKHDAAMFLGRIVCNLSGVKRAEEGKSWTE
jgi:hypothetical protein